MEHRNLPGTLECDAGPNHGPGTSALRGQASFGRLVKEVLTELQEHIRKPRDTGSGGSGSELLEQEEMMAQAEGGHRASAPNWDPIRIGVMGHNDCHALFWLS